MLHPLRYKLNKTSLSLPIPSFLPPSLLPTLPPSLPLPPILAPLSLRHTISIPFSLFFPTLLYSSTPSSSSFSLATRFFLPILSFSLCRTWIRSWLFAHDAHERRSYLCHTKQLCNTCHTSLTLSQFKTDNAIR
ncbi:hypothetical protein NP493_218g04026 [Ridgeia piscesae]|uniref:Uncharacterized protein n=1 Tax=Ridgeia piscesae TaxID=27915 RepID=A0AAD9P0U0_RIDPI|nr:hypothetical protein NP493_218g04026 [Ridgeia piscesae]